MTQLSLPEIPPYDEQAAAAARQRQNRLTKPTGSLGRLEELSIQLAGIARSAAPRIERKAVVVMAGDHGVVAEGVSAYPQVVTTQMVNNFLNGGAAINVLGRHVGAEIVIVDMGVAADLDPHPDLLVNKIGYGTANIAVGPAMTPAQAVQAIEAGIEIAVSLIEQRQIDIVGTGEMGIGNTTPSAAIAAAITGQPPAEVVGRGTGIDDAGLARKAAVVERALEANNPNPEDGLELLHKLGGFEIGGLAGLMIGAASRRVPVVIDGFISTAAAMIAVTLSPGVRPYLIAAHQSQERGHRIMLDWLGLSPLLDMDMRLGEGTGAALAISLAEAACRILSEMATFDDAGVSDREG
ncbi:MAG: nicotinate-nucleotide--dimethylbenzimidazole phosphoribosyltransferase [Anaerolineae bacterium]|nr:nicotinate-nucleotide--dimethylbenzimidazole phosphoribosyltransferase [Anaerolineae bacterium]